MWRCYLWSSVTGAIRNNNLSTSVRIKNHGLLILRHDRTCITCCLEIWLIKLMGRYDSNSNCSFAVFIWCSVKLFLIWNIPPVLLKGIAYICYLCDDAYSTNVHWPPSMALSLYWRWEHGMGHACSGSLMYTLSQFTIQGRYF